MRYTLVHFWISEKDSMDDSIFSYVGAIGGIAGIIGAIVSVRSYYLVVRINR